jgi:hypothetical protein
MLNETLQDRRLRLTEIAMDVLQFKYEVAFSKDDRNIVYTHFPKKSAFKVAKKLRELNLTVSVHTGGPGPTAEVVIYMKPSEAV